MDAAIADNQACLTQIAELLAGMGTEAYTRREEACFNGTIGGHVRHNLDHYDRFVAGWASGEIDYDARERDAAIEGDPVRARTYALRLVASLGTLTNSDLVRPVRVKMDTGSPAACWSDSTVGRELLFLLSHTVHHHALIAIILHLHGETTAPEFGVAPSTLRHQQAREAAACVR